MIKTKLCDLLDVKYPIIQAGMGPFQTNKLAQAVANAGGVGIISTSGLLFKEFGIDLGPLAPEKGDPYEVLKKIIYQTKEVTKGQGGVFGINVMVSDELKEQAKNLIKAVIDARDEDPDIKKGLKVIITSAGDPLHWSEVIKPSGVKWFHRFVPLSCAKKWE